MTAPFIIYALPRSRTYWLSRFLSYDAYECGHEQMRYLRGKEDARSWLAQDDTGTVETAAARWWRLIHHWRPDIRTVVVRRPVAEVVDSLMRLDMRGVCTFERSALTIAMNRLDRCLDQIERHVPDAVSVSFKDLESEQTCASLFEHCLPYDHDPEWWQAYAGLNMQISMPAMMRYYFANKRQIATAAEICRRQMRGILATEWTRNSTASLASVTVQQEPFDVVWRDGQTLFAKHAAEAGNRDGVMLNPNVALIRKLESGGAIQIMTARSNGEIVGYLGTVISPSLEDASLMTAFQSTFFVLKEFRGIGSRLQRESIDRLRARGIGEVVLRAGVRGSGHRLSALFERMGADDYGHLFNLMLKAA